MKFNSIFRSNALKDQVILVTGGGTGIGRCIAHEIASLGAVAIIASRNAENLDTTSNEIAELGGTCFKYQLDITKPEQIEECVEKILREHGQIDGLVNNAGGQFISPADSISINGWNSVVNLNLNGTFYVCQTVYKQSMKEMGGSIVNIVADVRNGFPGMAHSSAARAAIINLTKTLSIEWSSNGVRINAVAPGTIETNALFEYPEEIRERIINEISQTPPARHGTESEVSAAVVFLLSPAAAFITGATLNVDGGQSLMKGCLVPVGNHDSLTRWNGFQVGTAFNREK